LGPSVPGDGAAAIATSFTRFTRCVGGVRYRQRFAIHLAIRSACSLRAPGVVK
jgi:hypothetical protein